MPHRSQHTPRTACCYGTRCNTPASGLKDEQSLRGTSLVDAGARRMINQFRTSHTLEAVTKQPVFHRQRLGHELAVGKHRTLHNHIPEHVEKMVVAFHRRFFAFVLSAAALSPQVQSELCQKFLTAISY